MMVLALMALVGCGPPDDGLDPSPSCPNPMPYLRSTLDDFETGVGPLWYEFDDKSGTVSGPASVAVTGGAPGSTKALEFSGSGFSLGPMNYGAGIGRDTTCTNVARSTGLTFWAKGNTGLWLQLLTPTVVSVKYGGDCPETAVCDDLLATFVELDDTWKMYRVPWTQFRQSGRGNKDDFLVRKILNAPGFVASDTASTALGSFSFELDDIEYSED